MALAKSLENLSWELEDFTDMMVLRKVKLGRKSKATNAATTTTFATSHTDWIVDNNSCDATVREKGMEGFLTVSLLLRCERYRALLVYQVDNRNV